MLWRGTKLQALQIQGGRRNVTATTGGYLLRRFRHEAPPSNASDFSEADGSNAQRPGKARVQPGWLLYRNLGFAFLAKELLEL
jgi:hypothetical protein